MVACIFRIFNLFLHKNIHIPLVASTYVVFATTTATASNNYSAGTYYMESVMKKEYSHCWTLWAYIRIFQLLFSIKVRFPKGTIVEKLKLNCIIRL